MNNVKKNLWGQSFLVKIGISFFVILTLNIFQNQVKNFYYTASYPISNALLQSSKGINGFLKIIIGARSISTDNEGLKNENQELLSEISLLREIIKQDSDFKGAQKAVESNNLEITLVNVVGLNWAQDYIVIDKGLDDGILENAPVISKEKAVFGRVTKIYKNFSEISLISNKDNVINVKVQSEDPEKITAQGALRGEGNFNVLLDLIDFEAQINDGDILVTSGLDGFFPENLLVGKITSVKKDDLKPFQQAQVKPFFDVKNIDNLFVIKDYLK